MADLAGLVEEAASFFLVSVFSAEVSGDLLDCFVSIEVDCGQVLDDRLESFCQRLAVVADLFLNFGVLEKRCGDGSFFCEPQGKFGGFLVDAEVLDKTPLTSQGKFDEKIAGKGSKRGFGIRGEELSSDVLPLIFRQRGVGDSLGQSDRQGIGARAAEFDGHLRTGNRRVFGVADCGQSFCVRSTLRRVGKHFRGGDKKAAAVLGRKIGQCDNLRPKSAKGQPRPTAAVVAVDNFKIRFLVAKRGQIPSDLPGGVVSGRVCAGDDSIVVHESESDAVAVLGGFVRMAIVAGKKERQLGGKGKWLGGENACEAFAAWG